MAGSMTEIPVNGDVVPAYISLPPSGSGPGVVVIQEWWGLVPHIRNVTDRLAAQGRRGSGPQPAHDLGGSRDAHRQLCRQVHSVRALQVVCEPGVGRVIAQGGLEPVSR